MTLKLTQTKRLGSPRHRRLSYGCSKRVPLVETTLKQKHVNASKLHVRIMLDKHTTTEQKIYSNYCFENNSYQLIQAAYLDSQLVLLPTLSLSSADDEFGSF